MSVRLPVQSASVFSRRRSALAARLGDTPALVFAGTARARNYPANPFPYRAESHFIYLTGAAIEHAVLVIGAGRSELYAVPPGPDDALWHGPQPDFAALAEATGVDAVRPLAELEHAVERLGGRDRVATIPAVDPVTRHRQSVLLGRDWSVVAHPRVDTLGPLDQALCDAMIALRLRHDDAGLEMIRAAVEGSRAAHLAGMAATRVDAREQDVRAAMERELVARGMEPAYGSIVTVHGEVLHNNEYGHLLRDGDMVLADVGAEHHGWASDVTRTWPVSGTFSASQRSLYDIVLQANRDAIEMIAPGVRYRDVHLRASLTLARGLVDEGILRGDPETLVERGAHALLFPHGVGHLLGLDVHDMEDLGDRAGYAPGRVRSKQFGLGYLRLDRDLEPGMVVTIEPGLYRVPAILDDDALAGPFVRDRTLDRDRLARFSDVRGIRIEDDVLCTPTGHEVLTAAIPKDAAAVEAVVRGG